jgi:hypothetical protein
MEDLSFTDMEDGEMKPEGEELASDPMEDLNEALSTFKPEDIVKWLVDNGIVAPETKVLGSEELTAPAEGAMPPAEGEQMAGADTGAGISFSDMLA